jgi:hypothetical protein
MQGLLEEQMEAWQLHWQGEPSRLWCRSPSGANWMRRLGPKMLMVGTPSAEAKCSGPVSPEIMSLARFNTAKKVSRPPVGGRVEAWGIKHLSCCRSCCSRSVGPEEKTRDSPDWEAM